MYHFICRLLVKIEGLRIFDAGVYNFSFFPFYLTNTAVICKERDGKTSVSNEREEQNSQCLQICMKRQVNRYRESTWLIDSIIFL
jgi:hypothetical protein